MQPMIPFFVLTASALALSQFGFYLWRAAIISIAAESYSSNGPYGGRKASNSLHKHDFRSLSAIHDICPTLQRPSLNLQLVRAYYQAIQAIGDLCEARISFISNWAALELDVCTRCAEVLVDQRRRSTQACFAEASSY
ncbi:MAG: hypothetical protein ACRD4K_01225 [Candidatus Acidiferrales bacterium]